MLTVLITGSQGYIGVHLIKVLLDAGIRVIGLDRTSERFKFQSFGTQYQYMQMNIQDKDLFKQIPSFDIIVHLAAVKSLASNLEIQTEYLNSNLYGTLNLVELAVARATKKFIFASSAAVYGPIGDPRVSEESQTKPATLYGQTKLSAEMLLGSVLSAHQISNISLRFFNVVGQSEMFRNLNFGGLFQAILHSHKTGLPLKVFGNNFQTIDGTQIRDYIDVRDLCEAIKLTLQQDPIGESSGVFNLGSSRGYTVLQVISLFRNKYGRTFEIDFLRKRFFEVEQIIAENSKFAELYNWTPKLNLADSLDSLNVDLSKS
jgi:UDP-glucose 4-epimerase